MEMYEYTHTYIFCNFNIIFTTHVVGMKNNSINMQKNIKSLKIVNYCRKIIAKLFS